ncbi:MAG: minor capsid protein [Deltaproteobacteria bacterium]|nr:minor capsid protein [Deltaproteobacteria bacterium]
MKKFLNPILDKNEYYAGVQKEIEYYLYDLLYRNLVNFLRENMGITLKNAKTTSLKIALKTNKVTYVDGYFVGKFNSSISKELLSIGAKWSTRKKGYRIELINVPMDVRESIATGASKLAADHAQMRKILAETEATASQLTFKFSFEQQIEPVFKNLNMQFVKTAAGNITVTPEITTGIKETLIEKYNTNMDLYIKQWQEVAIVRLRDKVEKNVFEGFRADTLERIIVNEFQVSRKKAKFLAMQETSLLVSKFREERYKGAGVNKYKWSTSGDARVRDSHKHLNGKVFSWDNPPITNNQGDRNNPGEDWGCRCIPIPIID